MERLATVPVGLITKEIYNMVNMQTEDSLHSKNVSRYKYNGKDCMYTLSICNMLTKIMERQDQGLQDFYKFQQHAVSPNIVTIMNRGTRIDLTQKEELLVQFTALMEGCVEKINYILMEEVNLNSTPQVKKAFKELLGIKPILNRKTKAESFGSDAMLVYLEEYPEWRTLLTLFLEYKSIKVFVRTFLSAKLDNDGRMRCDYNPAGTKTYRLSSRKNVFGNGMNLANVPSHGKIDLRVALQEILREDDNVKDVSEINDTEVMQFQTEVGSLYKGITVLPNVKKIFLPDNDDWMFFDADYSAIDLHFVVWEADCKYLKDIMKRGDDVYSILASEYYQRPITKKDEERQIFKAICHGCLTGEHEVLTPEGWVYLSDITDNHTIAVWDKSNKNIAFEEIQGVNRDYVEANENLIELKSTIFNQLVTLDHKFPYSKRSDSNYKVEQAEHLPAVVNIPANGFYIGGQLTVEDNYMRLIAALQADGRIQRTNKQNEVTFAFRFSKTRKITRLENLLKSLHILYIKRIYAEKTGDITYFEFTGILEAKHKKLGWYILEYSKENLLAWVDELKYWDGHVRTTQTRTSISTTDKLASEIMQTIIHLTGKCSQIGYEKSKVIAHKDTYNVSINTRKHCRIETKHRRLVAHTGTKVYCPKTSTGFFMVKYNGHIMVTGNTNYLGKPTTLAAKAGLSVARVKKVQDWYFKVCEEIPQWHRRVENEARKFKYVRNIFGARFWNYDFNDPMWLNKVVAAIPQSSAAILVNKALCELERVEQGKNIQVLLQTHDSLSGQYLKTDNTALLRIKNYMELEIPYKDVLKIPAAIKTSSISYGDCS